MPIPELSQSPADKVPVKLFLQTSDVLQYCAEHIQGLVAQRTIITLLGPAIERSTELQKSMPEELKNAFVKPEQQVEVLKEAAKLLSDLTVEHRVLETGPKEQTMTKTKGAYGLGTGILAEMFVSDLNARAGDEPDSAQLQTLAASIMSVGLLQAIVVIQQKEGLAVVAGRRRFLALKYIHSGHFENTGLAPEPATIPILSIEPSRAAEATLAENYARETMNTRQLYQAFETMAGADETVGAKQLADAFGLDVKRAQRILRLSRLAPTIRDAWYAGEISDGVAQAYAGTPDHVIQIQVWEETGRSYPENIRHEIARAVTGDNNPRQTMSLLDYVGKDAYLEEGGTLTEDLFSEYVVVDNRNLLLSIANEKLTKEADAFAANLIDSDGKPVEFKWVDEPPTYKNRWDYDESYELRVNDEMVLTPEIEAEIAKLEGEATILEEEMDEGSEAQSLALIADLDRRIEKLRESGKVQIPAGKGPVVGIAKRIGANSEFMLYYVDRAAAGLEEYKTDDDPVERTLDAASKMGLSAGCTDGPVDASDAKKELGASRDNFHAMQLMFADRISSGMREDAETMMPASVSAQMGLDALLFGIAYPMMVNCLQSVGTISCRDPERGGYKLGKLVEDYVPLSLATQLGNPDWASEPSLALAWEGYCEWLTPTRRNIIGAALLSRLWSPLSNPSQENERSLFVQIVGEAVAKDFTPSDWAKQIDGERKVALGFMSHKARVALLNDWGLADHAKTLKKDTSVEFVCKILDADPDQDKLYGISAETRASIDAWVPSQLAQPAVSLPLPEPEPKPAVKAKKPKKERVDG